MMERRKGQERKGREGRREGKGKKECSTTRDEKDQSPSPRSLSSFSDLIATCLGPWTSMFPFPRHVSHGVELASTP